MCDGLVTVKFRGTLRLVWVGKSKRRENGKHMTRKQQDLQQQQQQRRLLLLLLLLRGRKLLTPITEERKWE